MIAVAFALRDSFGSVRDVERDAFTHAVVAFARERGFDTDLAAALDVTNPMGGDGIAPSSVALQLSFSTVLLPYLLTEGESARLEAAFRMEAARLTTERFAPFADVAETLRELASLNVPLVALSGGWPSVDWRKAERVGFAGPIVFAEDLGVDAGSPRAFARVAETVGLSADRIWFVGTDVRREILPARAAGMHTIWINRDGATFPADRTPPDVEGTTFAHVLDAIGEPYTRGLLALRHVLHTVVEWRPGHFISADDDP